ncbi:33167_t:CDS:1, partial [Gigaspora margarita]
MINHLRDIHHITKMSLENKTVDDLKKPLQQTLDAVISKPHSKQYQQKLTRDIVRFFLTCTLPLSLIENENFRTFINAFDPRYKSPCINTLKHEISDAALHTTQNIKYMINTQADMISLTFDLWTSRAHDSYLGITCHWISEEFKLYDFTLSVTEM